MGFIKEFKEFALKGNVMDMAVGIIIGGAFGLIVKAFIADIVMPIVGIAGKADFSNLYIPLNSATKEAIAAKAAEAGVSVLPIADAKSLGSVLAWGDFVTVAINFLILAFAIFVMVKVMNSAKSKMEKEAEAAPPPAPPEDLVVLQEIRDLLKQKA